MSLRRKLGTASSLTWRDWGIFFQSWFLLPGVDWGLRLFSFRRVQDWALGGKRQAFAHSPENGSAGLEASSLETARRVARQVGRAARNHLYPMSCLRRSLVLQHLLRRREIAAALRIGVRREDGMLQAHAWVEVGGVPIDEPEGIAAAFPPLNEVDEAVKIYEQSM